MALAKSSIKETKIMIPAENPSVKLINLRPGFREVKLRHIGNCLKADPAYGKGVADALSIPINEVPKKA